MKQHRPAGQLFLPAILIAAQILASSAATAAVVKRVDVEERGSMTQLTLETDGPVRYEDFVLSNPERLVIDCLGSTSLLPPRLDFKSTASRVRSVSTAEWTAKDGSVVSRLVCELSGRSAYSIATRPNGLVVVLDAGGSADGLGYDEDHLAGNPAAVAAGPLVASTEVQVTPPAQGPAPAPSGAAKTDRPLFVIEPKGEYKEVHTPGYQISGGDRLESRPGQEKKVSLDVQRASIRTVLRTLAEIAGRNIVSNTEVTGDVTVRLEDVPWPQALDIVLLTRGLGFTEEEDVLRIASLEQLRKEQVEQRTAERKAEELLPLETRVIPLNFAKADEMKQAVDKQWTPRGHAEIDPRTNSIIITDISERVRAASALVEQLDTRTPQVQIESKLVDIDVSDTSDFGITWTFAVTQPGSGDLNRPQEFSSINPIGGAAGELRVGAIRPDWTLDMVLQALAEDRKANIISNPRITTVNNREAAIMVGQEVPLIVQDEAFNTVVQLKQIGIKLKVRPHINSDRQIELDVHPEVSDLSSQSTVQGGIIINTAEADTRVLVNDGETAVIGGLIRENEGLRVRGIPWLKDIPGLGWLFSSTSKVTQKRELMIFITPRIVE
jgi:type IV pilus secretin PilQ/predicted competence protein